MPKRQKTQRQSICISHYKSRMLLTLNLNILPRLLSNRRFRYLNLGTYRVMCLRHFRLPLRKPFEKVSGSNFDSLDRESPRTKLLALLADRVVTMSPSEFMDAKWNDLVLIWSLLSLADEMKAEALEDARNR